MKMDFFLMAQGSINPKIRFLDQKVCPVACSHTDRQSDYCGHPFRVSGFFPSTYHQGSAQHIRHRNSPFYTPHTFKIKKLGYRTAKGATA